MDQQQVRKPKWGVIGCGVVGTAIVKGLDSNRCSWWAYDKETKTDPVYDGRDTSDKGWTKQLADTVGIYLALPTPAGPGGYDIDQFYDVLETLKEDHNFQGAVVIVSTMSCEDFRDLESESGLLLTYSPEFLTAREADTCWFDTRTVFYAPDRRKTHVAYSKFLSDTLQAARNANCTVRPMSLESLVLLKRHRNLALMQKLMSAKIAFADAINHGLRPEEAQSLVDQIFSADPRLKTGQDYHSPQNSKGTLGFGGMCFPKDLKAVIEQMGDKHLLPIADYFSALEALNKRFNTMRYPEDIDQVGDFIAKLTR